MIFQPDQIRTGLFGLIGLKDGYTSEYEVVSTANKATSSGMYFQDFHSLVTVPNLRHIEPEGLDTDGFNSWWGDLVKAAIVKNVSQVMQRYSVPSVFENLRLYDKPLDVADVMTLTDNTFVGFEIEVSDVNNIRLLVDAIGLTFDGAMNNMDFYLFHSSQDAYISKPLLNATADTETWQDSTLEMNYVNDTYVGGRFYLGYRSQDAQANPINREYDEANVRNYAHMFTIRPIEVPGYNTDTLFSLDDVEYTADTYGMNFSFSAWNDITKQIKAQKNAFINVIGYGVAVEVLERLANSTRDNMRKNELQDKAAFELNLEGTGLRAKLEGAIKQTTIDLQLDDVSTPPSRKLKTYTL